MERWLSVVWFYHDAKLVEMSKCRQSSGPGWGESIFVVKAALLVEHGCNIVCKHG